LPDSFRKKIDFDEDFQIDEVHQIPSLTEDIVYCPKCGTINSYKKSRSGKALNYFCSRCSLNMNDFWDGYLEGHIKQIRCSSCQRSTFERLTYCIACGTKQEKVFRTRAEKISDARGIDLDITSSVEHAREIRQDYREKMDAHCPGFTTFSDCLSFCSNCANCKTCCIPIGGCTLVQIFSTSTHLLKTAFSISFVLYAMLQTSFYILFFYSYISNALFYGIISIGIIFAILIPILIHKIQKKRQKSRTDTS